MATPGCSKDKKLLFTPRHDFFSLDAGALNYLQYCEAAFASRNISVVQAVYTRPNNRLLHSAF
jgi:hypothetical protein